MQPTGQTHCSSRICILCHKTSPTAYLSKECHSLFSWSFLIGWKVKVLANEDTLLRTHCCSWCVLGCANWETFVADTKCFWTKSETFYLPQTQNLCPQQMLRAQANGETFVSATMCPQQCVLLCQGLYMAGNSTDTESAREFLFYGPWAMRRSLPNR